MSLLRGGRTAFSVVAHGPPFQIPVSFSLIHEKVDIVSAAARTIEQGYIFSHAR
jgi:hypothetical protein